MNKSKHSPDGNQWSATVGYRGCIYPCSGRPLLRTRPEGPWVAAHALPEFLQTSPSP